MIQFRFIAFSYQVWTSYLEKLIISQSYRLNLEGVNAKDLVHVQPQFPSNHTIFNPNSLKTLQRTTSKLYCSYTLLPLAKNEKSLDILNKEPDYIVLDSPICPEKSGPWKHAYNVY